MTRLEAFSDGVIAILITIMVLELEVPHGAELHALGAVVPQLLTYVLSFVYVAIYWNNHHHLLHTVQRVSGGILWANMHLLFWLSLVPFVTGWMGENHFAPLPTAIYGVRQRALRDVGDHRFAALAALHELEVVADLLAEERPADG